VGAVGPGPMLRCVVREALGGVAEVLLGLLLRANLLLGSVSLAGSPPLATRLSTIMPRNSELSPLPVAIKNGSRMQERGVEIWGRT
jgi:hypothetical protein